MRKGENECRNESPGRGCTGWRRKGEGGKQSFKAGASQLQGESLSSGRGNGHPRCLCSMDAQTSSEQLHCLVELQRQPSQEKGGAGSGRGLLGGFPSPPDDCPTRPHMIVQCGVGSDKGARGIPAARGLSAVGHNPERCSLPWEPSVALESESTSGLMFKLNCRGKSLISAVLTLLYLKKADPAASSCTWCLGAGLEEQGLSP